MANYLAEGAVKERITSKINGGMFVTKLARTYRILEQGAARMLTMIPTPPFNTILFRRARIVEDFGGGNISITNDDAVLVSEESRIRVTQRREHVRDDPPFIPVDDKLRIYSYNVELRRYQDDLGQCMNYHNCHLVTFLNK